MQHFLDKKLFRDSLYAIYSSSEGRSIKLFNLLYGGLLGYSAYSYYNAS